MKMFNDSNSFYYCHGADMTNTIQRRHQQIDVGDDSHIVTADDRFFWNKYMLAELVDSDVRNHCLANRHGDDDLRYHNETPAKLQVH